MIRIHGPVRRQDGNQHNGGPMNAQVREPDWRPRRPLIEGTVVLWWMTVESPPAEAAMRWSAGLDEGERMRAERFRFAVDRETYIAAHALTRALLAHLDGLP